jgi:hypothetical protein
MPSKNSYVVTREQYVGWAKRSVPTIHDAEAMVGTLRSAHPTTFNHHGEERGNAVRLRMMLRIRRENHAAADRSSSFETRAMRAAQDEVLRCVISCVTARRANH